MATVATLSIHIDTLFSLMSPLFEHSSIFSTPSPSSPEVLSLYLSSFPFRLYHPSPKLLHLDRYRFILVIHVLTSSLYMTHLLWRPPPRRWSCRLPLILPSLFVKVLVPLVIPILFMLSCLVIVYLHHILLLFSPCLLFLFLTPYNSSELETSNC